MARITPVQVKMTVAQRADKNGNFYPACIFSNSLFMEKFEEGLIVAKSTLEPEDIEYETIESILKGVSDYRTWREHTYNKTVKELPEDITEHFALMPESDCTIDMHFKPLNNLPTEAMFFTLRDIKNITFSFEKAFEIATEDQKEPLSSMIRSFRGFLDDWENNQKATGTYFASEKTL